MDRKTFNLLPDKCKAEILKARLAGLTEKVKKTKNEINKYSIPESMKNEKDYLEKPIFEKPATLPAISKTRKRSEQMKNEKDYLEKLPEDQALPAISKTRKRPFEFHVYKTVPELSTKERNIKKEISSLLKAAKERGYENIDSEKKLREWAQIWKSRFPHNDPSLAGVDFDKIFARIQNKSGNKIIVYKGARYVIPGN